MAYDDGLAQRIRETLTDRQDVVEKRMLAVMNGPDATIR